MDVCSSSGSSLAVLDKRAARVGGISKLDDHHLVLESIVEALICHWLDGVGVGDDNVRVGQARADGSLWAKESQI